MASIIHAYVEYRDDDRAWVPDLTRLAPDPVTGRVRPVACPFEVKSNPYLCALLAGVERQHEVGVPPIAPPRGLPADLSDAVRAHYRPEYRYHDPTWLSFAELAAIDWRQVVSGCRDWYDIRFGVRRPEITFDLERIGRAIAEQIPEELGVADRDRLRLVVWFDE